MVYRFHSIKKIKVERGLSHSEGNRTFTPVTTTYDMNTQMLHLLEIDWKRSKPLSEFLYYTLLWLVPASLLGGFLCAAGYGILYNMIPELKETSGNPQFGGFPYELIIVWGAITAILAMVWSRKGCIRRHLEELIQRDRGLKEWDDNYEWYSDSKWSNFLSTLKKPAD